MLHACNAVDGTAKKHIGGSVGKRFTTLLRANYPVLGPMGIPGIDLERTRWPVKVKSPSAVGGKPDLADVIYGVHRCTHGHGDELPDGFELIKDASGPAGITRISAQQGKVRLSDRIIFGLLAVAILCPVNVGQTVPDGYHLTFAGQAFLINEWWGRYEDFLAVVGKVELPKVVMNFTDWMDGT